MSVTFWQVVVLAFVVTLILIYLALTHLPVLVANSVKHELQVHYGKSHLAGKSLHNLAPEALSPTLSTYPTPRPTSTIPIPFLPPPHYSLEYPNLPGKHTSDLGFLQNVTKLRRFSNTSIPALAIFVRVGTMFLERSIKSVDFPVDELLVVQDGEEESTAVVGLLTKLASNITGPGHFIRTIRHVINRENTGCAQGWNTVYRLYPNDRFWIFSANDIKFMPGQLATFYAGVIEHSNRQDVGAVSTCIDFGDGKIRRTFGLMTWAVMRQGVLGAGLYDENFYPSYFEDDDIMARFDFAQLKLLAIPNAVMLHGDRGYYEYGTVREDKTGKYRTELGRSRNQMYLQRKWNAKNYIPTNIKACLERGNGGPGFCFPYNNTATPITFWNYSNPYRECVVSDVGKDCGVYLF